MPQPMTPAPDAGQGIRKVGGAAETLARAMAGLVSPAPKTVSSDAIALVRAMLPGGMSWRQEQQRYNEAAAPDESVMDRNPLPGEPPQVTAMRYLRSPEAARMMAETGTMAAPIVVHASPVKWSGQPTREKAGSGEGGAAYGEGLYGSIPANARGIDQRYRETNLLAAQDATLKEGVTWEQLRDAAVDRLKQSADEWEALQISHGPGWTTSLDDAKKARNVARALELATPDKTTPKRIRDLFDGYAHGKFNVEDMVDVTESTGSFHVWDVPDTLLDWDAPLTEQPAGRALMETDAPLVGKDSMGWRGAPEGLHEKAMSGRTGKWLASELGYGEVGKELAPRGVVGHRYLGESGSSGEALGVPNFVIYDDAAVKPLGTFNSADEFLSSPLYQELLPRIQQEQAALVQRYPHLRSYFGMPEAMAGAIK